jgi:hypothetical protein
MRSNYTVTACMKILETRELNVLPSQIGSKVIHSLNHKNYISGRSQANYQCTIPICILPTALLRADRPRRVI